MLFPCPHRSVAGFHSAAAAQQSVVAPVEVFVALAVVVAYPAGLEPLASVA